MVLFTGPFKKNSLIFYQIGMHSLSYMTLIELV